MKKIICKVISIVMCIICICAIVLCIRVVDAPVYGLLDFRDIAFAIYGGIGILSAIIAYFTGKNGWKKD